MSFYAKASCKRSSLGLDILPSRTLWMRHLLMFQVIKVDAALLQSLRHSLSRRGFSQFRHALGGELLQGDRHLLPSRSALPLRRHLVLPRGLLVASHS